MYCYRGIKYTKESLEKAQQAKQPQKVDEQKVNYYRGIKYVA